MGKFNVGDMVVPKAGHYTDLKPGSPYNIARHPSRIVDAGEGFIVLSVGPWMNTPALNPESFDLAESTGPVRTVTRREIVPGEYGGVTIFNDETVYLSPVNKPTADELREASHLLAQLAEVLEENAREAA